MASSACGVCLIHQDAEARTRYEIARTPLWILRHHPDPAPLEGWLLLDARRHLEGPIAFNAKEAAAWGSAVQQASQLVQQISGCDRVYAIAFGEGARHLHLHLIPRFVDQPDTEAWRVADLYRAVVTGQRPAAAPQQVAAVVQQGRSAWGHLASTP
jgi:diadenosine tetraphosphate (Ap4A) HIT family hydrolase